MAFLLLLLQEGDHGVDLLLAHAADVDRVQKAKRAHAHGCARPGHQITAPLPQRTIKATAPAAFIACPGDPRNKLE